VFSLAQVFVIACFLVLYLHDVLGDSLLHEALPAPIVIAAHLVGFLVILVPLALQVRRSAARLDQTGNSAAADRADAVANGTRIAIIAWHAVGVLVLGFADSVRGITGDLVLVDELLVIGPAVTAISLVWALVYPIDRRFLEATILRRLDDGQHPPPLLSRLEHTWLKVRHHVLMALIPISLIVAWNESFVRIATRVLDHAHESRSGTLFGLDTPALQETLGYAMPVLHLAGVLLIMSLLPLMISRIWDTVRLDAGPLRDRIEAVCRAHNVRVRDLLVWRTHGSMVNGAVLGVFGPLRYILLTDRLLETMSWPHIEAVTAHEVGHIRRRHLAWLAISTLAALACAALVVETVLVDVFGLKIDTGPAAAIAAVATLGFVLVVFGFFSRRFEWQADAFAAASMSAAPDAAPSPGIVTAEAVGTMTGALDAVAFLNGISRTRRSFRHGSIAERQSHLRSLVGVPVAALPIDRRVRLLKRSTLCALVIVCGAYSLTAML
jgi:STE24 endopeptidase